uniref:Major facilitator superfamily (MFS) profile domain-containing protein n=1 Tax=Plectus sambesii TaxID=2011161 RepID=A0A914XJ07_9BILA
MAQNYGSIGGASGSHRLPGSPDSFGFAGLEEEEDDVDEHSMLLSGAESLPTVLREDGDEPDHHDQLFRAISASYAPNSILVRPRRRRMVSETDVSKMRPFMAPPYLFPSTQTLSIMASLDNVGDEDEFESSDSYNGSVEAVAKDSKPAEKRLPKLTSRQILTIVVLAFANFCSTVAFSCIAPFYPDEVINLNY